MMLRKRAIIRIAFVIEILIFGWFYQYGLCGMMAIEMLREENRAIDLHIHALKQQIAMHEAELEAWLHDPFYKEKLAREQLHMAREGEEIYLLQ